MIPCNGWSIRWKPLFRSCPIALLGYYLINVNYRNYWLLLVSLIFFAWGGVSFTAILIGSIILLDLSLYIAMFSHLRSRKYYCGN